MDAALNMMMAASPSTDQVSLDVYQMPAEDAKLLAEIGLSAAVRGSGDAAKPIFDALTVLKPDNPIGPIGHALGDISAGRPKEAVAGLRAGGIAIESCSEELQAIMLIALCLAGERDEASRLCGRLLNGGLGPSRQIALRLKQVIDAGLPTVSGDG